MDDIFRLIISEERSPSEVNRISMAKVRFPKEVVRSTDCRINWISLGEKTEGIMFSLDWYEFF